MEAGNIRYVPGKQGEEIKKKPNNIKHQLTLKINILLAIAHDTRDAKQSAVFLSVDSIYLAEVGKTHSINRY